MEPTPRNLLTFFEFARAIVQRYFPDELTAYDIEGPNLVTDVVVGQKVSNAHSSASGEFQFLPEAASVLSFIGLLWSTYEILQKILVEIKKYRGDDIRLQASISIAWKKKLRESGIDESTAQAIVDSFSADLVKLVKDKI